MRERSYAAEAYIAAMQKRGESCPTKQELERVPYEQVLALVRSVIDDVPTEIRRRYPFLEPRQ